MTKVIRTLLLAFGPSLGIVVPSHAHPHILAEVRIELHYENAKLAAVKEFWRYDAFYSEFLRRQSGSQNFSPAKLNELGNQQIRALADFNYYTQIKVGDAVQTFLPATDYALAENENGALTLRFTLPLAVQAQSREFFIEIFDPQLFAYFSMNRTDSVKFDKASPDCKFDITTPSPIDLKHTATVPAAFWSALSGSSSAAQQFVNRVKVSCP
jgi:ABC-type uncharacterized transport system substrate-binding protein